MFLRKDMPVLPKWPALAVGVSITAVQYAISTGRLSHKAEELSAGMKYEVGVQS